MAKVSKPYHGGCFLKVAFELLFQFLEVYKLAQFHSSQSASQLNQEFPECWIICKKQIKLFGVLQFVFSLASSADKLRYRAHLDFGNHQMFLLISALCLFLLLGLIVQFTEVFGLNLVE
jgi:hypothetical protein